MTESRTYGVNDKYALSLCFFLQAFLRLSRSPASNFFIHKEIQLSLPFFPEGAQLQGNNVKLMTFDNRMPWDHEEGYMV